MAKSTVKPSDKREYAKVKGQMKKKGKGGGGGDPKAFKSFKKKVADLERKQRDRQATLLNKIWKENDKILKVLKKVKDEKKLPDEKKRELVEKLIQQMLKTYELSPTLKAALSRDKFEKEVRKAVGALPDDDRNAANGHVDAIRRKLEEESRQTQETLQDIARMLNLHNKKVSSGGTPDLSVIIIALVGIATMVYKKFK